MTENVTISLMLINCFKLLQYISGGKLSSKGYALNNNKNNQDSCEIVIPLFLYYIYVNGWLLAYIMNKI